MSTTKKATFAAGCFWGVEDTFMKVPGVVETMVGFTGGTKDNPTYEQVCEGDTGHAEATQVTFDPEKVTYKELLDTFFELHDPTQVNHQGPDTGHQYRSAIFTHTDEQQRLAEEAKKALNDSGQYKKPVATEIEPAGQFWKAEEYHQKYFQKTGESSCHV
ncbi:MAG: peptide-methionine (S)-S-oxide reductase MsrA [Candidatus Kerfeldbacteria bacterium]